MAKTCSREKTEGMRMQIELVKWSPAMKQELMNICNKVDRTFLSNRMPYPYTEEAADWWLGMVQTDNGDYLCYDVMILSSLENVSRPTRKNVDI